MRETFLEQASMARDRYVAFLRRAIETWKTEAVEVLVQPNGRDTPSPFCLCRVDAILGTRDAPRIQRACDDIARGPELRFRLTSGLEVHQRSFSWEALGLEFTSSAFRIELLAAWLDRWLDAAETRVPDLHGLAGVVHDLAWSQSESDEWCLRLDLGSAPLLALEELLDLLSSAGVQEVALARTDLDDN